MSIKNWIRNVLSKWATGYTPAEIYTSMDNMKIVRMQQTLDEIYNPPEPIIHFGISAGHIACGEQSASYSPSLASCTCRDCHDAIDREYESEVNPR